MLNIVNTEYSYDEYRITMYSDRFLYYIVKHYALQLGDQVENGLHLVLCNRVAKGTVVTNESC